MKILEAELKNFGNLVYKKMEFHEGLNVMYAPDGTGKSTMHEFLFAMLYGLSSEECIRWQSWNGDGILSGRMRLECAGKTYLLERDFLAGKHKGRLYCETDQRELSLEDGDLAALPGMMDEDSFCCTFFVGQRGVRFGRELSLKLRNHFAGASEAGDIDVNGALESLEREREELEQEKKQAQTDLISRQQEIRMKLEYAQQDIGRLKGELADAKEQLSLLNRSRECWEEQRTMREKQSEHEEHHRLHEMADFLHHLSFHSTREREERERREKLSLHRNLREEELTGRTEREEARLEGVLSRVLAELREKQIDCRNLEESERELSRSDSRLDCAVLEEMACSRAIAVIGELSREIYRESEQEVSDLVSATMEAIAGKEKGSLFLDRNLEFCLRKKDSVIRLSDEYYDTAPEVCFAARMAAGRLLGGEEPMPIILDDTFYLYGEESLERVFSWLERSGIQVLLFSSRDYGTKK